MVQSFVNYCEAHLDFSIAAPSGYRSAPLCALDSVFSIGVRYASVENVVGRFLNFFGDNIYTCNRTTTEVVNTLGHISPDVLASNQYLDNRQRTDTHERSILKTDAYLQFIRVMQALGIETCQDIAGHVDDVQFHNRIRAIRGQSSGLTLDYLYILAGVTNYVKVDRHIQRFVFNALGQHLSKTEIIELIRESAEMMSQSTHPSMNARWLDHIIWSANN